MKKMMMIAAVLFTAVSMQAATMAWGTGTTILYNSTGSTKLQGVLMQLLAYNGSSYQVVDSTLTSSTTGFKGTAASTWSSGSTVPYTVAAFPAGRNFYFRVWDTSDTSGNHMDIYANGANQGSPTYWTTTSVTDADAAQTSQMSANGYGATLAFVATPEPTSLALLAIGAAALGLRRKLRK